MHSDPKTITNRPKTSRTSAQDRPKTVSKSFCFCFSFLLSSVCSSLSLLSSLVSLLSCIFFLRSALLCLVSSFFPLPLSLSLLSFLFSLSSSFSLALSLSLSLSLLFLSLSLAHSLSLSSLLLSLSRCSLFCPPLVIRTMRCYALSDAIYPLHSISVHCVNSQTNLRGNGEHNNYMLF